MDRPSQNRQYEQTGETIPVGSSFESVQRPVPMSAEELLLEAKILVQEALDAVGQLVTKRDGTFTGERQYTPEEVRAAVIAHGISARGESAFDLVVQLQTALNSLSDLKH